MPGTVKVKVIRARNLPVMDRSTYLTDAFVEIRLGPLTYKTEVCRHSLNPIWNTDWYKFEMDDLELQEQALQIRVLDHDTYSSHDAIGRVYFDLNPLLGKDQTRSINAWFPIYDTMHGIRGEINLVIRVEIFSDASRFRQSSVGVRFFYSTCIPHGYSLSLLGGLVSELCVNMDPEYQWFERLRSSRASNEARQRLFSQLSGEIQRKLGVKVLELGCNCVLGYQLYFDLEGETGVVARGIGTAAHILKCDAYPNPRPQFLNAWGSLEMERTTVVPKMNSVVNEDKDKDNQCGNLAYNLNRSKMECHNILHLLESAEFPFITLTYFPSNFIICIGSIVSSKSVKLIEGGAGTEVRVSWWKELRNEIRSHMKSLDCNCVIAYREECSIYEDVILLSVHGTAVVFNHQFQHLPIESSAQPLTSVILESNIKKENYVEPRSVSQADEVSNQQDKFICSAAHVAYRNISLVDYSGVHINKCLVCKRSWVPDVIFSSSELPPELVSLVVGQPTLIQVRTSRYKKESKGEACARELSSILPFIEFEMHRRLMHNLKLKFMNSLFALRIRISIGKNLIVVIATGTAVYLSPLPSPLTPHLNVSDNGLTKENFTRLQEQLQEHIIKCQKIYKLQSIQGWEEQKESSKVMNRKSKIVLKNLLSSNKNNPYNCEVLTTHENDVANSKCFAFQENANAKRTSFDEAIFIPREEIDVSELMRILDEDKIFMRDISLLSIAYPPTVERIHSSETNKSQTLHLLTRFMRLQLSEDVGSNTDSPATSLTSLFNVTPSIPYLTDVASAGFVWLGGSSGNLLDLPNNFSGQITSSCQVDVHLQQIMAMQIRSLLYSCRQLRPCTILGLDCNLCINEDNQLQVLLTGLCVPTSAANIVNQPPYASAASKPTMFRHFSSVSPNNDDLNNTKDKSTEEYLSQNSFKSQIMASSGSLIMDNQDVTNFVISPLSYAPFHTVDKYLGNLDFFFVRESTAVRDYGGVSGFVQACIAEVQTVVRAHAISLGGNALLNFHFSETQVLSSTNRNQAQCLLNVCADMVCVVNKSPSSVNTTVITQP